jgi:sulfate permease, SulP family
VTRNSVQARIGAADPRPRAGRAGSVRLLERHPDNEREEGLVVLRVEGGLFANADEVRRHIPTQVRAGTRAIVLDAETVPFIDLTAA